MLAWRVARLGEPRDVLRLVDVPDPVPGPDQLRVGVLAGAIGFPDVLMCRGAYQVKPPLPFTPGLECCGEVLSVGEAVTDFRPGDRVLGGCALPHGSLAQEALMNRSSTFRAPDALSDEQASGFFVAFQTAWFALHQRAGLRSGETVLVHAAAGGVGSAAVQVAKATGARVVGVVGGAAKAEVVRRLGADVVVDRHTQDFVAVVEDVTGGAGADVVFDPVGGETYRRSTKCIAVEGRIALVGFAGGQIQEAALNHPLVKEYSIIGLHWGLYRAKDPTAIDRCHAALMELVANGLVAPLVGETVALDAIAEGAQRLADGATTGRVTYSARRATRTAASTGTNGRELTESSREGRTA